MLQPLAKFGYFYCHCYKSCLSLAPHFEHFSFLLAAKKMLGFVTVLWDPTFSCYACQFLNKFWPSDKVVYGVDWVLPCAGVYKTSLLPFKDKHILMLLPYFLVYLKRRCVLGCCSQRCCLPFRSLLCKLYFFLINQSRDCLSCLGLVKCF